MLDTMTLTKASSGFLGAFLVLLLGSWLAEELYDTDVHYDESHVAGYSIAVPEPDTGPVEEVIEVPFEEVYLMADAGAGEALWRQCQACHANVAGSNGVGPYLHGVVGREIAAVDGFGYSDALAGIGGAWTPEALNGFIEAPRDWAPGTAMSYNGLADIEDRANLIAYLDSLDD
ncbi:MAG: cytochrome c family protein [Pseudomonadota bacterium]